jgi:hypothetical protein
MADESIRLNLFKDSGNFPANWTRNSGSYKTGMR